MSIEFQGIAFSNILCEREKVKRGTEEITYGSLRLGVTRCRIIDSHSAFADQWLIPESALVLEISYRVNHYAEETYQFIRDVSVPSKWNFEINKVFTSRKLTPTFKKGRTTHYVKAWGNTCEFTNSLGEVVDTSLLNYEPISKLNKTGKLMPVKDIIQTLVNHSNEDLLTPIISIPEFQVLESL